MTKERTCYSCERRRWCSLHRDVDDAIQRHLGWFDLDSPKGHSNKTPGHYQDIFEATAKACEQYVFTENQ